MIQDCGSKNIGATNILRIKWYGRLGFLTLFFDVLKGFPTNIFLNSIDLINIMAIVSVIIGHLFPIWIKFKGGKGIAVLLVVCWHMILTLDSFLYLFGFL